MTWHEESRREEDRIISCAVELHIITSSTIAEFSCPLASEQKALPDPSRISVLLKKLSPELTRWEEKWSGERTGVCPYSHSLHVCSDGGFNRAAYCAKQAKHGIDEVFRASTSHHNTAWV
jgi:hypothetical protein